MIPPYRLVFLKVKRSWLVTISEPMVESHRPKNAANRPLKMEPLLKPTTMVIAIRQRLKYSHGPSIRATSAMKVEQRVATMIETRVPIKEPVIPMVSARAA